jgi:hypothetical protein
MVIVFTSGMDFYIAMMALLLKLATMVKFGIMGVCDTERMAQLSLAQMVSRGGILVGYFTGWMAQL